MLVCVSYVSSLLFWILHALLGWVGFESIFQWVYYVNTCVFHWATFSSLLRCTWEILRCFEPPIASVVRLLQLQYNAETCLGKTRFRTNIASNSASLQYDSLRAEPKHHCSSETSSCFTWLISPIHKLLNNIPNCKHIWYPNETM